MTFVVEIAAGIETVRVGAEGFRVAVQLPYVCKNDRPLRYEVAIVDIVAREPMRYRCINDENRRAGQ